MERKLRRYATEVWIFKNIKKDKQIMFILEQGELISNKPYKLVAELFYIECLKRKDICLRLNYSEAHIIQIMNEIILMIYVYLLEET